MCPGLTLEPIQFTTQNKYRHEIFLFHEILPGTEVYLQLFYACLVPTFDVFEYCKVCFGTR